MLEEELNLEGADEVCRAIENISDDKFLFDMLHSFSISAPLK